MARTRIAIINTSEDVATSLKEALDATEDLSGVVAYVVDFREGRADLREFLRRQDPAAIIWDIAIPYDVNWRYFAEEVRPLLDRPVVLTTTNKRVLEQMVGPTACLEIVGKPYDLGVIVQAVQRALAQKR